MKHNVEAGTNFIINLYESVAGSEKDFFSGRAKQLSAEWMKEVFFETDNNVDAWEMFFGRIKAYEIELEKTDDKTKSSILQTIKIVTEILSIMKYQIVVEKRKIFCINDFIYNKDAQLFMVNSRQYESKLTPYISGLWGAINAAMMGKEDTKEHLILHVMDEFLTMKLDDATRKSLLTLTRSKGGCNVISQQYLPKDEKLIQDLDSSRYALITFNINDDFTIEKVAKKLSEVELLTATTAIRDEDEDKDMQVQGQGMVAGIDFAKKAITSPFGSGKKNRLTYTLSKSELAYTQQLQSMPKYHHLTFIPSEEIKTVAEEESLRFFNLMTFGYDEEMQNLAEENPFLEKDSGILYLGYTPISTMDFKNKHFEAWDMKEYYIDSINASKQIKEESKMSEADIFAIWLNTMLGNGETENYGLNDEDMKELFKPFAQDEEKVTSVIEKHDKAERIKMAEKLFEFMAKGENTATYNFCKQNDLIGAIPDALYAEEEEGATEEEPEEDREEGEDIWKDS